MAAVSSEPLQSPCGCYKCTRGEYDYTDDGEKLVVNNVHGELQPCETCGRAKTEYVDHYTWGEYRCWWCKDR
jgi:hypothetical protein